MTSPTSSIRTELKSFNREPLKLLIEFTDKNSSLCDMAANIMLQQEGAQFLLQARPR